jgi:hypothetical protein
MRHLLAVLAVVGLAAVLALGSSDAATLVVSPGGSIQAAVNAANAGDTISVKAGTYYEQVNLSGKAVTLAPYGDGQSVLDGQCQREHGVYIGAGSGQMIQGFTITNTVGASVLIENGASNITIDGNTLQNFDCQELSDDQYRAGVASWYGGSNITITNNLIQRRTSGGARGWADGIWFKSNDANPSGGGHYIAGNTIIGGWDGIGGEEEGSAHGSFDGQTIIEGNTIRDTWDDGIQVEGGDQGVRVQNNDISGAGTGVAFAAPITGPLYISGNRIHDLVTGLYENHVCFKVGTNGQSNAVTYLTGNSCDVRGGDEANGIHQSGGDNMTPIVSRNNRYYVEGYVYYIADKRGQDYDSDCMYKVDAVTDNFAKWAGTYYPTFADFQTTGQEAHGVFAATCETIPTPTPTDTPTPWTSTSTPVSTKTLTPTPIVSTSTPGPTSSPTVTPIACEALDFDGNGQLSVVGDVMAYQGRIGEVCQ